MVIIEPEVILGGNVEHSELIESRKKVVLSHQWLGGSETWVLNKTIQRAKRTVIVWLLGYSQLQYIVKCIMNMYSKGININLKAWFDYLCERLKMIVNNRWW